MKGWRIFTHSVGMVVRNLGWAVRIALVPVLTGLVLVYAVLSSAGLPATVFADESAMQAAVQSGALGPAFFAAMCVLLVVQLWVFVSWHRFILLEEYPIGWFPRFRGGRILSYFGHGALIAVVALGLLIPLGLVLGLLAAVLGEAGGVLTLVLGIGCMICLVVAVYRLVPMLPAAAIGKRLSINEVWQATAGSGGAIVLVLILLGLTQFGLQLVTGLSVAVFAPLGFAFGALTMLVMTLVNVSVITTFYGHYVEGRPI